MICDTPKDLLINCIFHPSTLSQIIHMETFHVISPNIAQMWAADGKGESLTPTVVLFGVKVWGYEPGEGTKLQNGDWRVVVHASGGVLTLCLLLCPVPLPTHTPQLSSPCLYALPHYCLPSLSFHFWLSLLSYCCPVLFRVAHPIDISVCPCLFRPCPSAVSPSLCISRVSAFLVSPCVSALGCVHVSRAPLARPRGGAVSRSPAHLLAATRPQPASGRSRSSRRSARCSPRSSAWCSPTCSGAR